MVGFRSRAKCFVTFVGDLFLIDGSEGLDPSVLDQTDEADASSADVDRVAHFAVRQRKTCVVIDHVAGKEWVEGEEDEEEGEEDKEEGGGEEGKGEDQRGSCGEVRPLLRLKRAETVIFLKFQKRLSQ